MLASSQNTFPISPSQACDFWITWHVSTGKESSKTRMLLNVSKVSGEKKNKDWTTNTTTMREQLLIASSNFEEKE